jgi:molybdenum cofactor cytidylyltransferase
MKIAGILLAAGQARRFGDDKLMMDIGGRPLVDWAAQSMSAAGLAPLIAVVQPDPDDTDPVAIILQCDGGFEPVLNPRFAEGMSTSIAAGACAALERSVDAAVIALGDMPFVRPETYRAMIAAFERSGGTAIVMAEEGGRRGSPTLFPRALFGELAALEGDAGARGVVAAHEDLVVTVECATGELDDVDTPEALEAARRRLATR